MRRRARAPERRRGEKPVDGAPRQRGSLGGKCWPISPSPIAPEHRVGQRVQADIGVGMADQALVVRHLDAAEPDMIARAEAMDVEALAAAMSGCRAASSASAMREILRRRQFEILPRARHGGDHEAGVLGDRGVVGQPRSAALWCAARISG